MAKTSSEILRLIAGEGYYAFQKIDDYNRDDIRLRREDGSEPHIENYPYRVNQIPSYMFEEFLRDGLICEDGLDSEGSRIYRRTRKAEHIVKVLETKHASVAALLACANIIQDAPAAREP